MAQGTGLKSFVGFKTESTWGTAVAIANGSYNRVARADVKNLSDFTDGNRNLGKAFKSAIRQYNQRSGGRVEFDASYQGPETWLLHLFGSGSVATTTVDTTGKQHIFTCKAAQVVGATLEVHKDLKKEIYAGTKITKGTFTFDRRNPLRMGFDVIGKMTDAPGSVEAAPTFLEEVSALIPTVNPIEVSPNSAVFSVGDAGTHANPVTWKIMGGNLEMTKPHAEDDSSMGDPNILEPIINDFFDIIGSFERPWSDDGGAVDSFITTFRAGTEKSLRILYNSPTLAGAATRKFAMQFDIPYARYREVGAPVDGPGRLKETIPFIGSSPDGVISPVTLTLTNILAAVA